MATMVNYKPQSSSGIGLGGLLKIGIGAMTGGLGGAALGAAASTNTPLGKAAGLYNMGKEAYDAFSPSGPPDAVTGGKGQYLSGGGMDLGYGAGTTTPELSNPSSSFGSYSQPQSDMLGSMNRKLAGYGYGGR